MQILRVEFPSRYQQAPRLLQNPPHRLGVYRAVLLALVEIEAETGPQAHGADHGMVGPSIFMRHDACVGWILIDEHMVGLFVWTASKNMVGRLLLFTAVVRRYGDRQEARNHGVFQPVWERCGVE